MPSSQSKRVLLADRSAAADRLRGLLHGSGYSVVTSRAVDELGRSLADGFRPDHLLLSRSHVLVHEDYIKLNMGIFD